MSEGVGDALVAALVPLLSRSLARRFNVFRVMHHGTHEKQLSNVFAWLLRPDETHQLGSAFQEIFLEQVNQQVLCGARMPTSGYRVAQEVDAGRAGGEARDIADIVLASEQACVVVENYESSDGHGHDYWRYLALAKRNGLLAVVVLLCLRHEPHRLADGWENAVVITYAELLESLRGRIALDGRWSRQYQQQAFFIDQLVRHFLEVPGAVNHHDQLKFLKAMCETGESDRYGHRPQAVAAQEFANEVAQHAQRQFEEGRRTLAAVKVALRRYAEGPLKVGVNAVVATGEIDRVQANYQGQWEWCVILKGLDSRPIILLVFGPTAASENRSAAAPLVAPDFSKVFVSRVGSDGGTQQLHQTDVGLEEVLAGLEADDQRLIEAVVAAMGE